MDTVRFETSGSLGILTLTNPPLNLFNEELVEDLRAAVNQAEQLPLRALLVRADGKVFSGGADVSIFKGRTAIEARERFTSHLKTIADIEELPFPTIAAVQGACMAAGLELALACDSYGRHLRPASDRSRRRLERQRCWVESNVGQSVPARAGRVKSFTPQTNTTLRHSSDGTS